MGRAFLQVRDRAGLEFGHGLQTGIFSPTIYAALLEARSNIEAYLHNRTVMRHALVRI